MSATINRREFIKKSILAAAAFSTYPWIHSCTPIKTGSRKRVIVVGAGLAGLSSAYELSQAGQEVLVLEARGRPGGRVETLRTAFSDDLFAEAGAYFVSSQHTYLMKYIRQFNLALSSILPDANPLWYRYKEKLIKVDGTRAVGNLAAPNGVLTENPWPAEVALTPQEQQDGFYRFLAKYCALGELGDPSGPEWPAAGFDDTKSLWEFFNTRHASPGAIDLMRPWFEPWWDDLKGVSALALRRDAAIGLSIGVRNNTWYTIKDGMDSLPKAFAERLPGRIRYNSPVVEISQNAESVTVSYLQSGKRESVSGDYLICAIPFSTLRHVQVSPSFSQGKRDAIEQLPYASVARVYLKCKQRVWGEELGKGVLFTDRPIMNLIDSTFHQQGKTPGILHAYMSGTQARAIAAMPESQRVDFVLKEVKQIYPSIEVEPEHCTSKCWDEDEWARGAYPCFRPGQLNAFIPHIARPEGRIHFAGDHTSPWPGWMQGALKSGHRVACEVGIRILSNS